MKPLSFISIAFIGLGLTGCVEPEYAIPDGPPPLPTGSSVAAVPPESVAQTFLETCSTDMIDALTPLLSAKARTRTSSGDDPFGFVEFKFDAWVVGSAAFEDRAANVPVEASRGGVARSLNLKMRVEDGSWRVFAIGAKSADGSWVTLDLER